MPANQIQYSEKYYDEVGGRFHNVFQTVSATDTCPPPAFHAGPRLTVRLLLLADLRVQARCGAADAQLSLH